MEEVPNWLSSSSINDDLLTEILVLLPAKSLVRFKLVNTHWKFLISADSFRRRRCPGSQHSFLLGIHYETEIFICGPTVKGLIEFPISVAFPPEPSDQHPEPTDEHPELPEQHVKILQSCNGLLLLTTKPYDSAEKEESFFTFNPTTIDRRDESYFIFNPTTMDKRRIYKVSNFVCRPLALCLLFDPSKSPHYRVVGIWGSSDMFINWCSVFDSATGKWTDCETPPIIGGSISDVVSCNGRAYFLTTISPSWSYSVEEGMCTIPSPPTGKGNKYVMESNGHLYCIYVSFTNGNKPFFTMAEMIDKQWVISKRTGTHSVDGENTTHVEWLGMIRAERIEDSMFLVHVPGRIMIYWFDKECEMLYDFRSKKLFYHPNKLQFEFKYVHPFIESFASV